MADGEGFPDVEDAEEQQGCDDVFPVGVEDCAEQGDPNAGYFVDDDEAGVFAAAFAGGDGGCRNAQADGKRNSSQRQDEHPGLRGMQEIIGAGPDQGCCN